MNTQNTAIKAIVEGIKDGGATYFTNFPGFNSHHIFNGLGGKQISLNERIAFEMAYGASLSGKRSVATFKGVGMNVASDVFLHAVLNGVNAGIVVILTDDEDAVSSPERQDSRSYRDIFGGLWLEPTTLEEGYNFAQKSFSWSERFDIPIVIRLTNQFFALSGVYKRKPVQKPKKKFEKNRSKYISFWKTRDDKLKKKNENIEKFVNSLYKSQKSFNKKGAIIIGNCDRESKNLNGYDILKINTYPFPVQIIKNFVKGKMLVKVFEQGNSYGLKEIKSITNSGAKFVSETGNVPDLSKDWIIWNNLEKLFMGLKKNNPSFVVGDEGTFTDESTSSIHTCLAMGASIGIAAGMAANGVNYPFAVVGDTSYTFGAKQTLEEVIERKINIGIILLDNGVARSTGSQKRTGKLTGSGVSIKIVNYNLTSQKEFEKLIKAMKKDQQISILHVKYE